MGCVGGWVFLRFVGLLFVGLGMCKGFERLFGYFCVVVVFCDGIGC